jgi:hypothetical protein
MSPSARDVIVAQLKQEAPGAALLIPRERNVLVAYRVDLESRVANRALFNYLSKNNFDFMIESDFDGDMELNIFPNDGSAYTSVDDGKYAIFNGRDIKALSEHELSGSYEVIP